MSDSLMGHINDLEDRVSLLKEAIRLANETILKLSKDRDEWRSQCHEAEADRDDYKSQINEAWVAAQAELCKAIDMRKRAESAERKLAMAVKALRFYARHTLYQTTTVYMSGARGLTEIERDAGDKARTALAELEKADG